MIKRLFYFLIFIACLGTGGWWVTSHPAFLQPLVSGYKQLVYKPCAQPITYHLGTIDPQFHLNDQQVRDVLKKAENIWEAPTHKNLFEYSPQGDVSVNLTYDYRQDSTDKLKNLNITLDDTRASYDALKITYLALQAEIANKKSIFTTLDDQFQIALTQYNKDVARWNASAHHSQQDYDQIQQEKKEVETLQNNLKATQASLNATIDTYNAVVNALNKIAGHLNITADQYNTINQAQGKEFNEGLYESDITGQRITIFEFQNQDQLVRVLAHELGHALGLDHSEGSSDIMYRLNESKNEKLTANDIAAVQKVCE